MEKLEEEEKRLEAQLEEFRAQLSAVAELSENSESVDEDVQQLRDDLSQLVALTEENYLETKKQKLLLSLGFGERPATDTPSQDTTEPEASDGLVATESSEEDLVDNSGSVVGMKCRAPWKEDWLAPSHHNAIILSIESETTEEDVGVRVLFTHPCFPAMKPCSFFLEGRCKFSAETCRASHGSVVRVSELRPYEEPDFGSIVSGARCLVEGGGGGEGLWEGGVVQSVAGESVIVRLFSEATEQEVPFDRIVPLEEAGGGANSSEESSEEGLEGVVRLLVPVDDDNDDTRTRLYTDRALGEWEEFTKGFGSRLMAKMGYVVGQGLGKDGRGRVEPVKIEVLPPGKSLDVIASMRETKKLEQDGRVSKKRKRNRGIMRKQAAAQLREQQESKTDVFEFINTRLAKNTKNSRQSSTAATASSGSDDRTNGNNLNIKLVKIQEDIKLSQRRLQSLYSSLQRNLGRDSVVADQMRGKIDNATSEHNELVKQEKLLATKIKRKSDQKKLINF